MTDITSINSWLSCYGLPQYSQARVFAFPYSGGGASIFSKWGQTFSENKIDFIGVQLPGREDRLREEPFSNLASLVKQLLSIISPWLDKPFVFFGHSLGGLVAFELCRALHRQQLPLPKHLFISAFRAPELPNLHPNLHHLPEADIIKGLREYTCTPEAILSSQELRALFLPLLRADFSLHETYRYQQEEPLPCPITTLSAGDDRIVPPDILFNWYKQTSAIFQQVQYEGDHFFSEPAA